MTFSSTGPRNRVKARRYRGRLQRLARRLRNSVLRHDARRVAGAAVPRTCSRSACMPTTPGQRWDYFNRVKRMATIEAIPVPVADYVKDVEAPERRGIEEVLRGEQREHSQSLFARARLPSPAQGRLRILQGRHRQIRQDGDRRRDSETVRKEQGILRQALQNAFRRKTGQQTGSSPKGTIKTPAMPLQEP